VRPGQLLGVFGGFERFLHVFEYGLYSGIQSIYRFGYLAQNGIRNGDYLADDLILANWAGFLAVKWYNGLQYEESSWCWVVVGTSFSGPDF